MKKYKRNAQCDDFYSSRRRCLGTVRAFFFLLLLLVVVVGGTLNEISGSLCKCVSVVRFVVVGTINKLMACVCLFPVYTCV